MTQDNDNNPDKIRKAETQANEPSKAGKPQPDQTTEEAKAADQKKAQHRAYMRQYREQNQATTKRVSVTLTRDEYTQLKKNAQAHKTTPTKHLKDLAFASLDQQTHYPAETQASLKELVHILRGVGNNINQIARYSNTVKKAWNEDKALQHLIELEQHIQNFLKEK